MNTFIPGSGSSRQARGFSLIELLAVIAVVGILASLVIAVVGEVREAAKSTLSASNLRQWGVALHLYMNLNQERIPFEGDADRMTWSRIGSPENREAWFNVLPPFVDMPEMRELDGDSRKGLLDRVGIHRCPLVEWRDHRLPNFAYMMNSQIYHSTGPGSNENASVRYGHIQEPAATVMFADLNQSFNTRPRGRGRHVDARHRNGKTHLMFFDGHVERFDAEYVRLDDYTADGVRYTDNNKPNIIWNPWNHPRLP